jgi:transposase
LSEDDAAEAFLKRVKRFRAVATRYDKLAGNFLAGVQLAAAMILLN